MGPGRCCRPSGSSTPCSGLPKQVKTASIARMTVWNTVKDWTIVCFKLNFLSESIVSFVGVCPPMLIHQDQAAGAVTLPIRVVQSNSGQMTVKQRSNRGQIRLINCGQTQGGQTIAKELKKNVKKVVKQWPNGIQKMVKLRPAGGQTGGPAASVG